MAAGGRNTDTRERGSRLEQMRAEQAREERRRRIILGSAGAGVAALLVGALVWLGVADHGGAPAGSAGNAQGQDGQTPPGALAPAWTGLQGQSVDGVTANQMEQLAYHIHAHLAIYVDGTRELIPWGVGIERPWTTVPLQAGGQFVDGGMGYYYVHTHDDSGIIHIESPTQTTYTLGQFFAVWDQPLSTGRVGPASGPVTVYVDGAAYHGDPAGITLTKHEVIQLDVGGDVPFVPFSFPPGL